jgi:restriction system protein
MEHAWAFKVFQGIHGEFRDTLTQEDMGEDSSEDEHGEELAPEGETAELVDHRVKVLEVLQSLPASGFERFCQRLLRESGFGEVQVTGKSNDGGIDGIGILQVNALVSFKVLFQCKRYKGSVVPAQVRDFRGAMQGRADKGIILTTGTFTQEARREALRDGVPPIELVDGDKLIGMMEDLSLGLKPVRSWRVDDDFFRHFQETDI